MKTRAITLLAITLLLAFAASSPGQESVSRQLIGAWTLAPNQRAASGRLTFNEDGTYEQTETHVADGVTVTVTGQYLVDESLDPVGIDLCLQECGGPGSEWTTRFGILRLQSDCELEILTSPDGNRPTAFPEPEDPETMKLSREGKY